MKKFAKFASIAMALAMVVTAFAGCTGKSGGSKGSSDTIKIGGIGPITGPAAIYGQAVKNAAEIAIEEINALSDLKFEFKFEDDEHDPEKSVNAYNTLKDWGMQILMGTVTTGPCVAVSAETNADNIFTLTPSASSTDVIGGQPDEEGNVTIQRKANVFQMCFTDPNQGIASAQYISEQKIGEKIAVIYKNDDSYSTGIYQKFDAEAKKVGLNIVSVTTFTDSSSTDFTSQLNAAKSAGADLLFLPIYYTPASLILSQANSMNYDVKVFGVDGMDGILGVENFDTALAEDVMLLTPFTADAEDEKTQNFVKKYQDKFGEIPNQFGADAYDCIYAIYNACVAEGVTADMDAATICEKLTSRFTSSDFVFDGVTGTGVTWSETGEVSKSPKGMIIKNGAYVGM
ncbi:MAG: ABC transporter substrate-binding protein [Clostridia bacterium]|nr:ABC transporter substrate-binding protein [Clostridia bacterium]